MEYSVEVSEGRTYCIDVKADSPENAKDIVENMELSDIRKQSHSYEDDWAVTAVWSDDDDIHSPEWNESLVIGG